MLVYVEEMDMVAETSVEENKQSKGRECLSRYDILESGGAMIKGISLLICKFMPNRSLDLKHFYHHKHRHSS